MRDREREFNFNLKYKKKQGDLIPSSYVPLWCYKVSIIPFIAK